ncbi:MAG: hypothetical protein GEU26_17425 [Nitrososphaeraceae archaeon]|nr:hypothetical protein [Nitrososphaeraceae archaeon]
MTNTLKIDLSKERNRTDLSVPIGGQIYDHSNTPLIHDGIDFTGRGDGLHQEKGIVIFLDVLGMKGIWKNLDFDPREVINRWDSAVRSFQNALDENRQYLNTATYFKVLSDTIIITIPSSLSYGLVGQAFDLILKPFIESMKMRMLLRGVISYGTYYLSKRLIIGPAVDDAASNHNRLNWIGVSLSPSLASRINDIEKFATDSIIYYTMIPHKDTPYPSMVLNWPDNDPDGECYSILRSEGQNSADHIKYENTYMFYDSVMG